MEKLSKDTSLSKQARIRSAYLYMFICQKSIKTLVLR